MVRNFLSMPKSESKPLEQDAPINGWLPKRELKLVMAGSLLTDDLFIINHEKWYSVFHVDFKQN